MNGLLRCNLYINNAYIFVQYYITASQIGLRCSAKFKRNILKRIDNKYTNEYVIRKRIIHSKIIRQFLFGYDKVSYACVVLDNNSFKRVFEYNSVLLVAGVHQIVCALL